MRLNHIGVIVKDIDKSISLYTKWGYILNEDVVVDMIQHNRIAIMSSQAAPNIELIQPIDELSSVRNFNEGYHHICYEGEDGENIIQIFKLSKIGKIFTSPIIAPALNNRKVVFACLHNNTFIELII